MPVKQIERPTLPDICYNADLNKYAGVVLFPEKVAKAKASLNKVGVAKLRAATKK